MGPAVGISAGDELWVARYILEVYFRSHLLQTIDENCRTLFAFVLGDFLTNFLGLQRITEIAGVVVSLDPKPIPVSFSLNNLRFCC